MDGGSLSRKCFADTGFREPKLMQCHAERIAHDHRLMIKTIGLDIDQRVICYPKITGKVKSSGVIAAIGRQYLSTRIST